MTQEEFIKEVRNSYLKARKCIYPPKNNFEKLSRGTSHSISSVTEDLFGCYCAEKITKKENNAMIFIDPPISFKGTTLKNKSKRRALLIRPDLAFVVNDIATVLFDIKTDLGYKRKDFFNQAKERNAQLDKIKKKKCSFNDGETKEKNEIVISENIKFIYIIISQGNITRKIQDEFISQIKELENMDIFLLTNGGHLNTYVDEISYTINKNEFNRLDNIINTELNF
ncbi:hypothetical protein OEA66_16430 [Chryseobacterium sp. KC 927]|uniref:Uncharacterized protein n=2 Tax=Chryseobacterium luquanense TaxID=2983766 RepID=A0ABT3Y708_9FLAO|nr:hypothetical protein [Chryseobacterium luquanense]